MTTYRGLIVSLSVTFITLPVKESEATATLSPVQSLLLYNVALQSLISPTSPHISFISFTLVERYPGVVGLVRRFVYLPSDPEQRLNLSIFTAESSSV